MVRGNVCVDHTIRMLCRYLLPPPPAQRMGLYVCRLLTVLGLLLLLGGAAAIVVGYCWPREQNIEGELMRISIDQDEEGNFYVLPERLTEIMASIQDPMHTWKMTGQFLPNSTLFNHFCSIQVFAFLQPAHP